MPIGGEGRSAIGSSGQYANHPAILADYPGKIRKKMNCEHKTVHLGKRASEKKTHESNKKPWAPHESSEKRNKIMNQSEDRQEQSEPQKKTIF